MRLSVFGLGYVGTVSAACMADAGHHVIGVDPNETKTTLISQGRSPIIEPEVHHLIARSVEQGQLEAISDVRYAITSSDLSLICVGTPSEPNGNLDLSYLKRVCEEIGDCLRTHEEFHVVVIRSTVLPGTLRGVVIPILEDRSGKRVGRDFGVCNNPEFLREGTAVRDYREPPKTVIGESDERSGDLLASLYANLDAPMIRTAIEVGEMVKYADNAWHAVKVTFGNEIGAICKQLGIDSHEVMDIFAQDTKLNISKSYLRPGFAFGGSCLPKDLRALTYKARGLDLPLPMLNAVLPSNGWQIDAAVGRIIANAKAGRKIGVLGFSFKATTDDLRESPMVEVIERLIGKGYELKLFDRNVKLARLTGANREYILHVIPHIAKLMVDSEEEVVSDANVVVVGNADPAFREAVSQLRNDQQIVDLVRIQNSAVSDGRYDGIAW